MHIHAAQAHKKLFCKSQKRNVVIGALLTNVNNQKVSNNQLMEP